MDSLPQTYNFNNFRIKITLKKHTQNFSNNHTFSLRQFFYKLKKFTYLRFYKLRSMYSKQLSLFNISVIQHKETNCDDGQLPTS